MGYFRDDPTTTAAPTRLGDLGCEHENALEVGRSFGRWHDFATSGANSGIHAGVDQFNGHAEFSIEPAITAAGKLFVTYLDTANAILFDGKFWRLDLAVSIINSAKTYNMAYRVYWRGVPPVDCWINCVANQEFAASGMTHASVDTTASSEATLSGSPQSVIGVQSSGRLIGRIGNYLITEPSSVVVDFAITRLEIG